MILVRPINIPHNKPEQAPEGRLLSRPTKSPDPSSWLQKRVSGSIRFRENPRLVFATKSWGPDPFKLAHMAPLHVGWDIRCDAFM